MDVKVYRNLDRPFTLFGIKGKFIIVLIAWAAVALVLAIIGGTATNGFIGLGIFGVLAFVGYMGVTVVQERFSESSLRRLLSGLRLPKYIIVKHKPWKK